MRLEERRRVCPRASRLAQGGSFASHAVGPAVPLFLPLMLFHQLSVDGLREIGSNGGASAPSQVSVPSPPRHRRRTGESEQRSGPNLREKRMARLLPHNKGGCQTRPLFHALCLDQGMLLADRLESSRRQSIHAISAALRFAEKISFNSRGK